MPRVLLQFHKENHEIGNLIIKWKFHSMAFQTLSYKESGVCFFLLVSFAFSNLLQDQYITVKKKKKTFKFWT